jgi:serine/threonine protein kinase/dipeptidyl aminopeptidase/acylaminoacyl peptidase
MPILPGRRLGPYEILSAIGAGGMGEVYRARDTRLDRIVAIKVLPAHLADRSELRERFDREAKTIASLNHPHICTLYDTSRQDDIDFLVMEYLEGETLAQRLVKGALPLEQVLQYAIEIADALDKAHRKGITHRDLKPGNIMLTKSGTKLLDFGLAKLKQEAVPAIPDSQLPTMKSAITDQGTILGTLQYMAPEQVEAKEVDARTDIFAFGAVVYEMATGRKAFEGKTSASVMAAILKDEPPVMSSLQPMTPPMLDRVVKRCLAKEPEKRWQTASDLCEELKWIAEGGSQAGLPMPIVAHRKTRERLAWSAAGVFLLLAVLTATVHFREAPGDLRPVYFSISPPEKASFLQSSGYSGRPMAVSPDGSQVAFIAIAEGKQSIWVRPFGSLAARQLPGTEGATAPFWSPDDQYVGFFVGEKMLKVPTSGGPAQALCDMPGITSSRSGSWNREGTIVFGGLGKALYRVSASGGQPNPVTKLDQSRLETSHYSPHFLPDGHHFLYFARSSTAPANDAIFVGSLDSKPSKLLLQVESEAQYALPGYLLYVRDGTLTAQAFDANRLELSGEPSPVADQVESLQTGASAFSTSENGVLVYQSGIQSSQLVFVDRDGKLVQSVGPPGEYRNATLSPDGSRVVIDRNSVGIRAGSRDLWLYELARGAVSRLTFDPSENSDAVWSPDGKQIVFESTRGGTRGLYKKLSSGAGAEETLFKASDLRSPRDWSSDGKFILFERSDPKTGSDLWVLPLFGDHKPIPFLQSEFQELDGRFSPNGRWIAYDSNESGKREVYVQPFPASAGKWQISTNGGSDPIWRPDGKELFYLATDGKIMAEPVKSDATFEPGIPKALFQTMFIGFVRGGSEHYRVTADGQRILVNMPFAGGTPPPITVVLNWTAGLKK